MLTYVQNTGYSQSLTANYELLRPLSRRTTCAQGFVYCGDTSLCAGTIRCDHEKVYLDTGLLTDPLERQVELAIEHDVDCPVWAKKRNRAKPRSIFRHEARYARLDAMLFLLPNQYGRPKNWTLITCAGKKQKNNLKLSPSTPFFSSAPSTLFSCPPCSRTPPPATC